MRINYVVELPDPQKPTAQQNNLIKELSTLINDRAKNSRLGATPFNYINLILRLGEKRLPNGVKEVKSGVFLGFNDNLLKHNEFIVFADVLRNAINKNFNATEPEKNVIIFFSDIHDNSASLFSSESTTVATEQTDTESVKYIAQDPLFTLDEVIMSAKERDAVLRAITMIKYKDLIYNKWNFKKIDKTEKSILCFHGVPGTGKSMCAHAVASELGKKIILGSYAEVESEFVGVGAKNLVELFNAAQDQDAVLFIDEADTFLSKRLPSSNDSAKHYNSMSNQLYTLIESFNGCIVFASNHIKDFDPAVISRIIEPIEFRLPDFDARKKILDNMVQEQLPINGGKTDSLLNKLAEATEGFSGRDLRKAIQIAHAHIAYKYIVCMNVPEDEVVADPQDLLDCIAEVREAKEKINPTKKTAGQIFADFAEKEGIVDSE